jgi:hypothetical protein
MKVYTRDELVALRVHDVTPTRAVRKAIFSHQLWQSKDERKQSWWKTQRSLHSLPGVHSTSYDCSAAVSNDDRSARRSSMRTVKFGLLNAQSVGNSFTAIATTVDEGQYDVFLVTESWHTVSE